MSSWRWKFAPVLLGGLALMALAPPAALGQAEECNGFIDIFYEPLPPNPPNNQPPFDVRVHITIGAGDILGGTPPAIDFKFLHFSLDCTPDPLLHPICIDDGDIVSYKGDSTITTTCHTDPANPSPLVVWSSDCSPGGFVPNVCTFTPTPDVRSLAKTSEPAGQCELSFVVTVASFPSIGTKIPQIADYLNFFPDLEPNKEATCTNGLTSGGFQTADIGVSSVAAAFTCYQVKEPVAFTADTLVDMFGKSEDVPFDFARRLCTPAVVNDGSVPSGNHLVGYELGGKFTSTFQPVKGVTVQSQFGNLTVDLKRISHGRFALLVPSNKNVDGSKNPPPPPPPTTTAGHFLCYDLENIQPKGLPGDIATTDQFGTQTVDLQDIKDLRLCTPVDKNGGDPSVDPDATSAEGLLCYPAMTVGQSIVKGIVASWANQVSPMGDSDKLDKLDNFCTPATITKP